MFRPVVPEASSQPAAPETSPREPRYPCPCCGQVTFPVPATDDIAFICPICWWENDVFITGDNESSDENHGLTLAQAQANYRRCGFSNPRYANDPVINPP